MISSKDCSDISLLIFDLDGTLIDSETDLMHSVNATRAHLALEPLPRDTIASYVGQGVVTLVRRALGSSAPENVIEQAVDHFLTYYHEHMLDNTVLYPGVRETLDALQDRKMAVLTNKPVNFSRRILEGLGVTSRFVSIYGGNSFEQKKPDPAGVFQLMDETGIPPDRTMMIGDSDIDVQTGRNAGVWTCAVTYGLGSHTLVHAPADFLLNDFRELCGLLGNGNACKQFEKNS